MEENKKYMTSDNEYDELEEVESSFDWVAMVKKLWDVRKKLFKAATIGAVLGLFIAFSIPKQYVVSVMLSPEMGGDKISGGLASMAASFLGGSVGQEGADALNALLAPEIVSSTPFLLELLESHVVNEKQGIDTTFTAYLGNESLPWWGYILNAPYAVVGGIKSLFTEEEISDINRKGAIVLSKEDTKKLKKLRLCIAAEVDKKTSIITIGTNFQDPIISATIADSVVSKLQKYIVNYKISKAKEDCKYWESVYQDNKENYYLAQQRYAKYMDANSNVIYQSTMVERERLQNDMNLAYQTYSQVAQQLQMARVKVQEAKPVFTVVEPSVVPIKSINKSKLFMLVVFAFLSVAVVAGWELYGDTLKQTLHLK